MTPGISLRKRILLLLFGAVLAVCLLIGRLAYLQLVRGDELQARAQENRLWEVSVQARRGLIVDRNGRELAISVNADSVYAVPAEIKDLDRTVRELSEVLGLPADTLHTRLTRSASFSWVKRKVSDEEAQRLRDLRLPGIYFTQESRRFYPKGTLAAHLIGIAGIDNQGLEGIEFAYDEPLRGQDGAIKVEFDARGHEIPQAVQQYQPATDGATLQLTIDENIQYIVERELDRVMLAHQAAAGYVVVMAPKTGEILAMAIRPVFDPNQYGESGLDVRRNRVVSDTIPPGSAFKPLTAAAALEEGVISPETPFYDPGYYKVPGHTIHNWNRVGLGSTTFAGGFKESSNTIFARVAIDLGMDHFYNYLEAFGLTEPTGIELPGEAQGIFPSKSGARPVDLAVMGFGQTLTVTPLQMITALSAIANDGVLMRPMIAQALRSPDGTILEEFAPQPVRQVVSPETARTIRTLMRLVVEDGTGERAQVEGYSVGGKTGTSQKVIDGRIAPGKYIASFIGMVPVDDPELVIYVVIDEPQGIYYGGWAAAPVFSRIARDVLRYLDIPPNYDNDPHPPGPLADPAPVPNVVNLTLAEAEEVLRYAGFAVRVEGDGVQVSAQFPQAGVRLRGGSTVVLATSGELSDYNSYSPVTVPDLKGLTRQEAADRLARLNLRMDVHGEGTVIVGQDPAAGTRVPADSFVRVEVQAAADEGEADESANGALIGP